MLRPVIALAFLLSAHAAIAPISVDFDPAKTQLRWSLSGNVHSMHGTFKLKRGHIALEPASGVMTGDLVADAGSGDSGNGARDKRMNREILESDQFPEFRFTPQRAEGAVRFEGGSKIRVSGTFVIHGASHDLTIPMDVSLTGGDVTGTGKFSIPYVDWGLKDPSNFLFKVNKSVEVEIVAVGKVR